VDERASKRVVVDVEIDAQIGDRLCRAFVYDLSCDGCSIEILDGETASRRSRHPQLPHRHARLRPARLAIGLNAGVQFSERIAAAVVERLSFKAQRYVPEVRPQDQFGRPVPRPRGGHTPPRWQD
jgi:hypothetical protein